MKKFKKLYSNWYDQTKDLNNKKNNEIYRELREHILSNESKNIKFMSFLIAELSDLDFRCEHSIILLKLINKKNIVPHLYRNNLDYSSEYWIDFYENLILQENLLKNYNFAEYKNI